MEWLRSLYRSDVEVSVEFRDRQTGRVWVMNDARLASVEMRADEMETTAFGDDRRSFIEGPRVYHLEIVASGSALVRREPVSARPAPREPEEREDLGVVLRRFSRAR